MLEDLKKLIRKCPDCDKKFLGLALETGKEYGNYRIDPIEIRQYPLICNKCPECAKKCFEKIYEKKLEIENARKKGQKIEKTYILANLKCEKDYYEDLESDEEFFNHIDWFSDFDCFDIFLDDFDINHLWVEMDYQSRIQLIDLFKELKRIEKEKAKKELCAKEGHLPYKEYSYKGIKNMCTYSCERCGEVVTNPNYKKEEL